MMNPQPKLKTPAPKTGFRTIPDACPPHAERSLNPLAEELGWEVPWSP